MNATTHNSKGWIFFTMVSFAVAVGATMIGIWWSDISLPMKGFMTMGYAADHVIVLHSGEDPA